MKVGFFSKTLWGNFIKSVSVITGALFLILSFIDMEQYIRIIIGVVFIFIIICIYTGMIICANKTTTKELKINGTRIRIVFGDIFAQLGIKVIAFNEFFDTCVNNKIISDTSLNGIFINKYSAGSQTIDVTINNEERLSKNIVASNVQRKNGGKCIQYQLGTICPVNDYFLLALTHFDDDNRAYMSVEDYISCLMHMWNELDIYYAGRPIALTLLGNGITRFNNSEVTAQELLKYILLTFKASKVKFNNKSSLTIVLDEHVRDEINLYEIEED